MRQRVVIAMAPVSRVWAIRDLTHDRAIDVTIQAETWPWINRLKRENRMAVLFITHDMAVVAQMADRVVARVSRQQVVEEAGHRNIRKPATGFRFWPPCRVWAMTVSETRSSPCACCAAPPPSLPEASSACALRTLLEVPSAPVSGLGGLCAAPWHRSTVVEDVTFTLECRRNPVAGGRKRSRSRRGV